MSSFGAFSHLLLLIFASLIMGATSHNGAVMGWNTEPFIDPNMLLSEAQAAGNSEICALCTCCQTGTCQPQPCCMDVICNDPSRPKGSCAFSPKRCSCNGCNSRISSTP